MTQELTVSFKVFLQGEGLNEVRRFGVDRDVVTSFNYLKGKLQAVFPSLQGKNFTVAWKDSEGDEVLISSDDELIIALTEQQTDVRKLYVTVKPGQQPQQRGNEGGEGSRMHMGVTCDGCEKGVEGFRYKCIQCPDFDLCTSCENKGLHSEHYMIRMPVPTNWRPHFGKRLAHHLFKAAHKAGHCGGLERECSFKGHHGGKDHHHHGGKHFHGKGHHGGPGWLENLASYLNEWSLPGDEDMDSKEDETASGPSCSKQQKSNEENEAHVQYLRKIGKTVANLLDPLGIDVDVEVRTRDKNNVDIDLKSKEKDPKEGEKTANENEAASTSTSSSATSMEVDERQDKEAVAEREKSPEVEEWTVVNEESSMQQADQPVQTPAAPTTQPQPETGAVPKQPVMTTAPTVTTTSIYPPLFSTPMTTNPPNFPFLHPLQHYPMQPQQMGLFPPPPMMRQPPMARIPPPPTTTTTTTSYMEQNPHVRPHIAEAVDKMMSMGFSNDGGWLTQLLESKNGDISKALDVLQPVKKS